jgi:hypothetical protein
MKSNVTRMANMPPPPGASSGKSRKTLYAVVLIAIIVIAVGVGAYAMMNNGSPNNNPTPAPSQTTTPSQTAQPTTSASGTPSGTSTPQATSSPSGNQIIANFQVGKWANYTMKNYDSDGTTILTETKLKMSIGEGSPTQGAYIGRDCYTINMAMDMNIEGQTMTSTAVVYVSKDTHDALRMDTTTMGMTYGEDITPGNSTASGYGQIDPNTVIGYETKVVAAGTFTDCTKAQKTDTTTTPGTTTVTTTWIHQSVPIWGMVYMQSTSNGVLSLTYELTDYSR